MSDRVPPLPAAPIDAGEPLRCHLLFPPPWSLFHAVHLSLPLLVGHLERAGYAATMTDLNVEAARALLTEAALGEAAAAIEARLERADDADDADDAASEALGAAAREALEEALVLAPRVAPRLAEAVQVLGAAPRIEEVAWAAQVVRLAAQALSAASHPGRWDAIDGVYRPPELADEARFTLPVALAASARPAADAVERATERALERAVRERPARVYGIGCASSEQVYLALRCARRLRALDPAARVVLGGAAIPFIREAIHGVPALFDLVDAVVIGDGEAPLAAILAALEEGRPLEDAPNVHTRGPDGLVRQSARAWNAGLEPPARPVFRHAALERYLTPPTLPFLSARRCYWNRCTFCSITYDKATPFGPQPADALVEQLAQAVEETGARTFTFVDEAVPAPRVRRIAEAILARGLALDSWDALCRFEPKLDRATLEVAYRSGMRAIYFGLESGSPRVVERMQKGYDMSVAAQNLADCHAAGIWTHCFVMVGFPGEEEADLDETIAFLRANAAHLDSVASGVFDASIGSPVADDPASFGLVVGERPRFGLDYRLPQPGREALLARRIEKLRRAIAEEPFSYLNMGAVNAGNMLRDLAARTRKAGLRERQERLIARRRAQRRLASRGAFALARLGATVEVLLDRSDDQALTASQDAGMAGSCHGAAPALLVDRETGASALVPAGLCAIARRGAPLSRLDAFAEQFVGAPGLAYGLAQEGLLVDA